MKIWVSSLSRVHETARLARPHSAVSLLSPGDDFPVIDGLHTDEHCRVHLHDIREEKPGLEAPSNVHAERLLGFLKGWSPDETLLVHCWAGISRSTATAFIAACLHNPNADEKAIADAIAAASPTAFPNTRLVALADRLMGRGGRMARAAEAICADTDRLARVTTILEAKPYFIRARH